MMSKSIADLDQQNRQTYGRIYGTFEGLTPVLIVSDPLVIHEMCNRHFSEFADQFSTSSPDPMEMQNIAAASGDHWKKGRRIVDQSLSPHRIRGLLTTQVNSITDFIRSEEGTSIRICSLFAKHAVTTVMHLLWDYDLQLEAKEAAVCERLITDLGIVFTSLSALYSPYSVDFVTSRIPFWVSSLLGLMTESRRATRFYVSIVEQLITERLNDSEKKETRNDLLQSLIDCMQSGSLTRESVVSNAVAVAAVSWSPLTLILATLTFELAKDQQLQREVRQEIDDFLKTHNDVIEVEDLHRLPLLDSVVRETLRFYPSEVRTNRRVSCPAGATIPSTGIHLPHGTEIRFAFFALHFDPQLWDQPHVFDGRRFLTIDQPQTASYLPFGSGPRKCPASHVSLILVKRTIVNVLRNYNLTCENPVVISVPPNSIEFDVEDIEVQFYRRS